MGFLELGMWPKL